MAVRIARGSRSHGFADQIASGGDRSAIVLEFGFLSRMIASMQTMNFHRLDDDFPPKSATWDSVTH
jgi:hypothetical protein